PSSSDRPAGNRFAVTNQNATADSTADTMTPLYSAPMIEPPAFTLTKNAPMIEAMIDTAPSTSGYSTALVSAANISPPSSIVAMIVTAYVSNRSAAMPAQSPTLSPTLSAITAGLRGSSSGMPASTLPTRSAPTSAPLVKMPPPRRAKIEISDEPKARPTSACSAVSPVMPICASTSQ